MDAVTYLEDVIGAKFVKTSSGRQVWEIPSFKMIDEVLKTLGSEARAYNWCPVQQPEGPVNVKPTITI